MAGQQPLGHLQEFVAHSTHTSCLQIGRSTAGLLATGGDDFVVNVWSIGKTGVLVSLRGHSSPVTSVCFDRAEENVLAGSEKATIKLFDLEGDKVVRTITGHRAAVTALDMHKVGQFFASGSRDTNFKLWDRRERDCVATYKGHSGAISMLSFSPDGKWVATGASDGSVKVCTVCRALPVAGSILSMFP